MVEGILSRFVSVFLSQKRSGTIQVFTVLDRKRGTSEELSLLETFPEVVVIWLSEDYLSYGDAESALARYRGEVLFPQANDLGASATASEYYVDMVGKADSDLADLNAADESLEHTDLKTKPAEIQEVCRRADVAVTSAIIDVIDFGLGRASEPVAGDVIFQ